MQSHAIEIAIHTGVGLAIGASAAALGSKNFSSLDLPQKLALGAAMGTLVSCANKCFHKMIGQEENPEASLITTIISVSATFFMGRR